MSDLIPRASLFAAAAHAATGQKRKYTGEDYIVHPARVAALVASVGGSDVMIAAAWLHDVVEDTSISAHLIRSEFGYNVAALVDQLTNVSTPHDGTRAMRKEKDRVRLSFASPEAKTIKLADLIDNTSSIVEADPKFAKVYLAEKEALLAVLVEGNAVLWKRAKAQLDAARERLA